MKRNLTWKFEIALEKTSQGEEVRTWIDLLLFDQLVRGIIDQHGGKMNHWGIHRRWKNGKHEFKFWCYGEDCLGGQTLRDTLDLHIQGDATVKALRSAGYLHSVKAPPDHAGGSGDEPLPNCQDNLHQTLQRCYPKFIQRLCETLRDVVEDICKQIGPRARLSGSGTLTGIKDYYKRLEAEVKGLWFNDAAYAYFHFFHMVFGYPQFRAYLGISAFPGHHPVTIERPVGQPLMVLAGQFVLADMR